MRELHESDCIVRRVDELGRVVLPIELRRITWTQYPLEIDVNGDETLLKKHVPVHLLQKHRRCKEVKGKCICRVFR